MYKTESLSKLSDYRNEIEKILAEIDTILKTDFSDEYPVAYQHWIPQIKTALRDDTKWLSRGQYSMEYTILRIKDKLLNDQNKGVTKYIN